MLDERIESWYEKIGKKIIVVLCIVIVVAVIIKLNIIGLFAPFIVAWCFASFLNIFVTWSNKKINLPRGIGTILSMATILSGVISILIFLARKLWEQLTGIAANFPELTQKVLLQVSSLETKLVSLFGEGEAPKAITNLNEIIEQVMDKLSEYLTAVIPVAYNAVAKVPDIILFIVVMFVATFFMTKDYSKIKAFVKAQFSDTIVDKVVIMQRGVISAIGGYVKTQLILMSITFTICLIGLLLFRVSYSLLISVIIAIVDAFPIFGSGAILWPWALYNFVVGEYSLAIGLICIYGVIFITRQIFEPKILSTQIGVYALVTVMAIYIGYKTMGFFGLILGPAIAVVVKMLQNVGALPQFKPVKAETSEKATNRDIISKKSD